MLKKYVLQKELEDGGGFEDTVTQHDIQVKTDMHSDGGKQYLFYCLKFNKIETTSILEYLNLKLFCEYKNYDLEFDVYKSSLTFEDFNGYDRASKIDEEIDKINQLRLMPFTKIKSKNIDNEINETTVEIKQGNYNLGTSEYFYDSVVKTAYLILILAAKSEVNNDNNKTEETQLYNQMLNNYYCYGYTNDSTSFNKNTKVDNYHYDEYVNFLVDNNDGNLITKVNLLNTVHKKMPIGLSMVRNIKNTFTKQYLPHYFLLNYQYQISYNTGLYDSIKEEIIIENASGIKESYFLLTEENKEKYEKHFNHKTSSELNEFNNAEGAKYYNEENGSCMYIYNPNSDEIRVDVYDKNYTYYLFKWNKNDNTLYLQEVRSREGISNFYEWSDNNELSSISHKVSNSNDITLTYSSNRLSEIVYTKLKKKIKIITISNGLKLEYYTIIDSEQDVLLKTDILNFTSSQISCSNLTNDEQYIIPMSSNKTQSVQKKKNGTVIARNTYSYAEKRTTITNILNQNRYVYFDNIRRLSKEMDYKGNVISYEYSDGTNLLINKTLNKITSRLLDNNSFEEFNNDKLPVGWDATLNGALITQAKGVEGKCLKIHYPGNGEETKISQIITKTSGSINKIKGYIKNSKPQYQSVTFKWRYSYKKNGVEYNNQNGSYQYNSSSSDWESFELSLNLPEGIYNLTMLFEIIVNSNQECEICIDEINIDDEEKTHRNNLIVNGGLKNFNTSPDNWNFSSGADYVNILSSDSLGYLFDKRALKLTARGEARTLSQMVNISGGANETFDFSFMYKLDQRVYLFEPYIIIRYKDETTKEKIADISKGSTEWQIATTSISTEKPYESIEVGVRFNGHTNYSGTAYVASFQLLRKASNQFYRYDEVGNLTQVSNGNGSSSHIIYDDYNRVDSYINKDGTRFKYYYNSDHTLNRIEDCFGNKIEYEYDSNKYITKTKYYYEGEYFEKQVTNDNEGYETQIIDEFSKTITINRDTNKNIIKETFPNSLIINSLYSNYNELTQIGNINFQHNLIYEEENRNTSNITIKNYGDYKFLYDEYGNLLYVKRNDLILLSLTYKDINNVNIGLLETEQVNNSGQYKYNYDDDLKLISIQLNDSTIATFDYDENDQVIRVVDLVNSITTNYSYDYSGNVKKIKTIGNIDSEYYYDNLGNVQKTNYKISRNGTQYRSIDYNNNYERNNYKFNQFNLNLVELYNVDVVVGNNKGNGLFGLTNEGDVCQEKKSNNIPVIKLINNKCLEYCAQDVNKKLKDNKTSRPNFNYVKFENDFQKKNKIALWFKPCGAVIQSRLISLETGYDGDVDMPAYFNIEDPGIIKMKYSNKSVESTSTVNIGDWNLLIINIDYENNTISFSLNGSPYSDEKPFLDDDFLDFKLDRIYLGEVTNSSEQHMEIHVASLSVGSEYGEPSSMYNDGYLALTSNQVSMQYSTHYSPSNINTYDEVFMFNGSLVSNKGTEPIVFSNKNKVSVPYKYNLNTDYCRLSSYNDSESIMFGYDKLGYNLNLSDQGMISIKFRCEDESLLLNKEIFNFISLNDQTSKFKVYIQNGYLNVKYQDVNEVINQTVNTNWHTLTMFYDSFDGVQIYYERNLVGSFTYDDLFILKDCIAYIGGYEDGSRLNGQLSQLIVRNGSFSETSRTNMVDKYVSGLNKVRHINTYDGLNRMNQKTISTSSGFIKQTYTYDKTRVSEEDIMGEVRKYTYDALGNIIKIEKKNLTTSTYYNYLDYEYDLYGRLVKVTDYTLNTITIYTYKENGNILTKEIKNLNNELLEFYQYHYLSDDRLLQISKNGVAKDTFAYNGYYPINFNGKQITYEGRNIKTIGNNTYFYNEEGVRIKKIAENGLIHEYKVEGSKIIKEYITNSSNAYICELDYIYNQYNELISVEQGGKLYFYIKDITGNIIKLVDEGGNDIVKYEYDEYGKVRKTMCVTSTDEGYIVALYNGFIYKGYYYDVETQLFYCNSRYYSPELCRFISPDSIEYLDTQSINGLNLYCYCMNNPVNYKQRPVSSGGSVLSSSISSISNSGIYSSGSVSSGTVGSSRINWENGGFQIPIWISSLMSGSDFGASIAPALRTIYQYIRYPGVKDLNKLYGLDFVPGKLNTVCSVIGYGLLGINIGLSAWSNFTNDNLTTKQQWISFGVDTAYTLGTFGIGYVVGALVSLIPGIGVFIAPFVSAGVTWLIDWTNEKWGWLDDVKQWFNDL